MQFGFRNGFRFGFRVRIRVKVRLWYSVGSRSWSLGIRFAKNTGRGGIVSPGFISSKV